MPKGGHPRKLISEARARRAFNNYWENKMNDAQMSGNPNKVRAVKASMKRDILFGVSKNIRKNTTYLKNPGKYEYPNIDIGVKQYNTGSLLSNKQLDILQKGRNILPEKRGKNIKKSTTSKGKGIGKGKGKGQMILPVRPIVTGIINTDYKNSSILSNPVSDPRSKSLLDDIRTDQNLMNDRCLLLQSDEKLSIAEYSGIADEVMSILKKYGIPRSSLKMGIDKDSIKENCKTLRIFLAKEAQQHM